MRADPGRERQFSACGESRNDAFQAVVSGSAMRSAQQRHLVNIAIPWTSKVNGALAAGMMRGVAARLCGMMRVLRIAYRGA